MKTLIERHHHRREHRDYPELSVLIHQVLLPRIDPLFLLQQVLLLVLVFVVVELVLEVLQVVLLLVKVLVFHQQ